MPNDNSEETLGRILYVDDDPEIRFVWGELLRRAGYHVEFATDGEAGLRAFSSGQFDLIVTDHNMPRLSGVEMVWRIRASGSEIPIVMVSGGVPPGASELCSAPGALVILEKPVRSLELIETIMELGRGQHSPRTALPTGS